jgi:hypothetical protein
MVAAFAQISGSLTFTSSGWTVVLLARQHATATLNPAFFASNTSATDALNTQFAIAITPSSDTATSSNGAVFVCLESNNENTDLAPLASTTWAFATVTMSAGDVRIYYGEMTSSFLASDWETKPFSGYGLTETSYTSDFNYLGFNDGSAGFSGDILNLVVWPDKALTDAELQQVHAALKARHGL